MIAGICLDVILNPSFYYQKLIDAPFWKIFGTIASDQGLEDGSPKINLKSAFKLRLIEDEMLWTSMLKDRNLGVHIYL